VEDLVRAAQRGDPEAMDRLVGALAPWLGRLCGSIALDRGDDALQETLIAVLRGIRSLREPAALRAWARRIAVREAVRAAGGGREVPIPELPDTAAAEADIDAGMDVRAVLAGLAPDHRAVLVLRHAEDLSEEETADALGLPAGTVKSRLHRARQAFERRWDA
jgi:RNA polymerase sigma factor (sigma-70 family)